MAGLLDFDFNDPQQAGLLALASGLLSAGAPQTRRVGIGEALAGGLGAMGQAQQNAQLMQRKKAAEDLAMQVHQMQFGQMQQQMKDQEAAKQAMIDYANQRNQATQQKPEQFRMDTPISDYQKSAQPNDLPSFYGNQPAPRLADKLPSNTLQAFSKSALIQPQIEELLNQYKFYSSVPKPEYQAKAQEAQIALSKLANELPKFSTDLRTVAGADGKPINVQMADDGTVRPIQGGYGVAPKFREISRGGITTVVNENTLGDSTDFKHVIDPSTAANVRLARDRMEMERQDKVDPSQVDDVANLIASGRMAPLGSMAMRSPFGAAVMSRVRQINPNYDAKDFATMSKAERDFATGKNGNSVRSFNVSISHLDTLNQLADALENRDTLAINKLGNMYATQTGNPAPTNFEAAKKIVADEIVKAIVGTGGGVKDREETAKSIAKFNSPSQLKGVINTYKELMIGQLSGLEKQYKATTNKDDFEDKFLSDAAKNLYKKHKAPKPTDNQTSDDIIALLKKYGN